MSSFKDIFERWEKHAGSPRYSKDEYIDEPIAPIKKKDHELPTIDLHGMDRHEAVKAVSNFIEKHKRSSEVKIKIIHGAGVHSKDGVVVLKKIIRDYLSYHTAVRYHRPGRSGEGGQGVTIAFIKSS